MMVEELEMVDELEMLMRKAEQMALIKLELQEIVDEFELVYLGWNKQGWHTHHKEGKPCKAKVKPPYWHRVRSFCVRRGYH